MSSGCRRLRSSQRFARSASVARDEEELHLGRRRDETVQLLDRVPQLGQLEHVPGGCVGAGDVGGMEASLFEEAEHEGRAATIDHAVGDLGRHDLAPERVLLQLGSEAVAQRRREIAFQLVRQEGVFGGVGRQQLPVDRGLGECKQHGELGHREAACRLPPAKRAPQKIGRCSRERFNCPPRSSAFKKRACTSTMLAA